MLQSSTQDGSKSKLHMRPQPRLASALDPAPLNWSLEERKLCKPFIEEVLSGETSREVGH